MEHLHKQCKIHGLCRHTSRIRKDRKNKVYWTCLQCANLRSLKTGKKRREKLKTLFGGCCIICGYSKWRGALEFHHLDPTTKKCNVSETGFLQAIREACKCILLCSNCHREVEAGVTNLPTDLTPSPPSHLFF